jgi:hypothetical protein
MGPLTPRPGRNPPGSRHAGRKLARALVPAMAEGRAERRVRGRGWPSEGVSRARVGEGAGGEGARADGTLVPRWGNLPRGLGAEGGSWPRFPRWPGTGPSVGGWPSRGVARVRDGGAGGEGVVGSTDAAFLQTI